MSSYIQAIAPQILDILIEAGVLRAAFFGSIVRGEMGPNSDVDILVELPRDKTMFDLMDLETKLEFRLKKKVDLVTYRSLHHLLKDAILKEQVPIL